MGSCCSSTRGSNGWVYVAPNGARTKFATETEAKAEWIRAGGVGEYKPA